MWQVGSEHISLPCPWRAVCSSTRVLSPKYALKYGLVFFFRMGTFSHFCFDLLIRSVSLINQIGENHDVEKFSDRKQSSSKIKVLRSTAVYYTDNQKAFNTEI